MSQVIIDILTRANLHEYLNHPALTSNEDKTLLENAFRALDEANIITSHRVGVLFSITGAMEYDVALFMVRLAEQGRIETFESTEDLAYRDVATLLREDDVEMDDVIQQMLGEVIVAPPPQDSVESGDSSPATEPHAEASVEHTVPTITTDWREARLHTCLLNFVSEIKKGVCNETFYRHINHIHEIREKIRDRALVTLQAPTAARKLAFRAWLHLMLEEEKPAFNDTPWIWYDVIRPALMTAIGVLLTIFTLPARPFMDDLDERLSFFFAKPKSEMNQVLSEQSELLKEELQEVFVPASA